MDLFRTFALAALDTNKQLAAMQLDALRDAEERSAIALEVTRFNLEWWHDLTEGATRAFVDAALPAGK